MKLLQMIGLQSGLIAVGGLVLATYIRFPDWHQRPLPPGKLFLALLCIVSVLLFVLAWFTKAAKENAIVIWTFVMLFLWWYVSVFLWINTYGT